MERDFHIVKAAYINKGINLIGPVIKNSVLITGDWQAEYASGVVVIDHVIGKAEIHEKMRDVWYVLSGHGAFILGGELDDKELSRAGEWNAPSISGGEKFSIFPGDLIDISPGVARNDRLVALIVKVPI